MEHLIIENIRHAIQSLLSLLLWVANGPCESIFSAALFIWSYRFEPVPPLRLLTTHVRLGTPLFLVCLPVFLLSFSAEYHNALINVFLIMSRHLETMKSFSAEYHNALINVFLIMSRHLETMKSFSAEYHNALINVFLIMSRHLETMKSFSAEYHNALINVFLIMSRHLETMKWL